jgi:fatty-acyl-CoA synthase
MLTGLPGEMQDFPLTLTHVLRRMSTVHRDSAVVTQVDDEGRRRSMGFAQIGERAARLAGALEALGVAPGDRVGTLAWNTHEHLEAYYAVPCMGAVLHTLNIRMSDEQLAYTVNHAGTRVLIVDGSLVEQLRRLLPLLETVEHVVVFGEPAGHGPANASRYEELLAGQVSAYAWPRLDERAAAALCYTSGTTGDPKGVLYSHRALVVHCLIVSGHDTFRLRASDRVLAVVPMFHALGWNLAYVCGLIGSDLVMPAQYLHARHLAGLIEQERITYSAGVPTIWTDLLRHADERGSDLSSLRIAVCGGTQVPQALMQRFEEEHGVAVTQGWGMTETLPGATMAHDPATGDEESRWAHRSLAGRLSPVYEIRVMNDGVEQKWDGESTGEIEIRGPVVAAGYFRAAEASDARFRDGWLRTGDVGSVTARGWLRITDRAKDVIKSGGEWISSVDLEAGLMAHPAVIEAAVIAKPDERWSERPLACVVADRAVTARELQDFLAERFVRWWVPDEFAFLSEIPKTSVGKFDKKALRARLEAGELRGPDV